MMYKLKHITLSFLLVMGLLFISKASYASICCNCGATVHDEKQEQFWDEQYSGTIARYIMRVEWETTTMKQWVLGVILEDTVFPMMMWITEILTNSAYLPVMQVGSFFDAKNQMETRLDLEVERAKIYKDYTPSTGICRIASNIKSLSASERNAETKHLFMSQRAMDREMMNSSGISWDGNHSDKQSRLAQFGDKYCNSGDNDNGMSYLCSYYTNRYGISLPSSPISPFLVSPLNKDIDFIKTIDDVWTVQLDFVDPSTRPITFNGIPSTQDEQNVLALSANLYGHDLFLKMAPEIFEDTIRNYTPPGGSNQRQANPKKSISAFLDSRAVMAKRSVARNSFEAIASLKSTGDASSREFMRGVLRGLDMPEEALEHYTNPTPGGSFSPSAITFGLAPSYHAQMEILTKKIYQDPEFYTNLYDKPINVERKKVAMQAIGLIQKFDLLKSYLRQEAATSILLENALIKLEDVYDDEASKE